MLIFNKTPNLHPKGDDLILMLMVDLRTQGKRRKTSGDNNKPYHHH